MFTPETHLSGTLKVPARHPNLVDAGSLSVRKSKTGLVDFADLLAKSPSPRYPGAQTAPCFNRAGITGQESSARTMREYPPGIAAYAPNALDCAQLRGTSTRFAPEGEERVGGAVYTEDK